MPGLATETFCGLFSTCQVGSFGSTVPEMSCGVQPLRPLSQLLLRTFVESANTATSSIPQPRKPLYSESPELKFNRIWTGLLPMAGDRSALHCCHDGDCSSPLLEK